MDLNFQKDLIFTG